MKDTPLTCQHGVRRAAVIGAGTMGSGIAAQFANGGIAVDLLDLPDPAGRDARAEQGIARQRETGGFMGEEAAHRVRPGNLEDHFERLAEADWIVEVVVEDLAVKRDLYARIDAVRKPGALISSNTSTLYRADLVAGLSPDFARDFTVTHFFNPPRVMLPVEVVAGRDSNPAQVARVMDAAETLLGKVVIPCRDTPGFIANRIGCTWIAIGIVEASRQGLTVEEADAVMAALGIPRTGVFGLIDLVGLDLVPLVWSSLMQSLPDTDAINRFDLPGCAPVGALIEAGRYGRKSGAGFYRKTDAGREALDLRTREYRAAQPADPKMLPGAGRDLSALIHDSGKIGTYAWTVFLELLVYAAKHAPEIAADVGAVDAAVSLGYGWQTGPFALADRIGVDAIAERLEAQGRALPPLLEAARKTGFYPDGHPLSCGSADDLSVRPAPLLVAALKSSPPVLGNDAASLWDAGNGLHVFEMHTKMNSFAPAAYDVLEKALEFAGDRMTALVLANDNARSFSVGADLALFLKCIEAGEFDTIEAYLARGQRVMLAMKHCAVPVVAAVRGFALGGGCEFSMHANAVVAHAEAKMGLPEISVGLIPGWGGCTQLVLRAQQAGATPAVAAAQAFGAIFPAARSGSAAQARSMGFLRQTDSIVMHHDHVFSAACDHARAMCEDYAVCEAPVVHAAGPEAVETICNTLPSSATDTDRFMARVLARVLTGGDAAEGTALTEADMAELERAALMELSHRDSTRARMAHMLQTGKPLAN
jgi:3-hydroxyacyl-CoA dehydrogenase